MSGSWDRTVSDYIVVHHLGNEKPPLETSEELFHDANPKGYQYPEYEWGILAGGEVVSMRSLNVVGAHCLADYQQYQWGPNWWNKNSVSVVIANDNEMYPPTMAQINSLIKFLHDFMVAKGVGLDHIFPHNVVSNTDCPGKNLDWNVIINGVTNAQVQREIGVGSLFGIVVYFGDKDKGCAEALAEKYGCVICKREQEHIWKSFDKRWFVGGTDVKDDKTNVNLCGYTFADTLLLVASELKK